MPEFSTAEKMVSLVNRVNYPVTVTRKDGNSFIIPPKGKTAREFYLSDLPALDPKLVMVVR